MPSAPRTRSSGFAPIWLVAALTFGALSCGGGHGHNSGGDISSDECRFDPGDCGNGAGAWCRSDRDCAEPLYCCEDDGNCGGGMCTVECRDDRDCPSDMLCEHDMCFYACNDDRDCAEDMSCEHGNTVCEY